MNKLINNALLPLGIGLATIGVIFGLTIDQIFFFLLAIGIIFIVLSAIKIKAPNLNTAHHSSGNDHQ
jgi:hypothetical protein